jgi:thioredoxin-like negative regulator of GroEL
MRAKYRPYGDDLLQSLLIEGRLHYGRGNADRGKLCQREASLLYAENPDGFSAESQVEYAKFLSRAGDSEQARALLATLLAQQPLEPALAARADKVFDEPVSQDGKRCIMELNQRGIRLFKADNFRGAHEAFTLARARFPRNVELNLNLLQALIRLVQQSEDASEREQWLTEAEHCLHLIGQLQHDHPKFANYRRLLQEIQELQGAGARPRQH